MPFVRSAAGRAIGTEMAVLLVSISVDQFNPILAMASDLEAMAST